MKKLTNKQVLHNIINNIDNENDIEIVRKSPEKYYSTVDKYGISSKLNQIIDNFEGENPRKIGLYEKIDLNIGIICDEFLYYSLKDTANFIYIPYEEKLEINQEVDLFLVVSSWRGLDHSWDYVANPKGKKREKLIELIQMYKENDIPTIFYSKEDPVSYKEYLSLAKECDFIFTSARESIAKYKLDTGNENVDLLEFGVNPMYHNPIGKDLSNKQLRKQVTFAGSWMKRFPERNKEALKMFEGVNKTSYELCIIDRQYERQMERYHYPPFLLKNVSATIPHERLMKLHKATMWGLNLNSVKNSDTMFANRVYELQAMGNIVISNYNIGVHRKFSNILLVDSRRNVEDILKDTNFKEQKRLIASGLRRVMLNHTAYHRMAKVVNAVGVDYQIKRPEILIVGSGQNSKKCFNKQLYNNIAYIDQVDFDEIDKDFKKYDFIAFFSNNINYGEYYIETLLSTFAYTNADIVYMNKDKFNYTNDDEFIKSTSMIKAKAYSNNLRKENLRYFNIPRTELSKIEDQKLTNKEPKILTAIVPINGDYNHLEDKLIHSLNKYKIPESLDLILINNKQPDGREQKIIDRLLNKYPYIKYIESSNKSNVSKAKNVALKNVKTKFVVFLSPQNQVVSYNFHIALDKLKQNNNIDGLIGEKYKFDFSNSVNYPGQDILQKSLDLYDSIDSVILNTSFLDRKNIIFDEAINDDKEIFLLKVLSQICSIIKIDKIIYNDYIPINNMDEKSIEKRFDNVILIENKKRKILEDVNLLEKYSNTILPFRFLNSYLTYFRESGIDKTNVFTKLQDLFNLYESYYNDGNREMNQVAHLLFGYNSKSIE